MVSAITAGYLLLDRPDLIEVPDVVTVVGIGSGVFALLLPLFFNLIVKAKFFSYGGQFLAPGRPAKRA
jgi:hypothetical protein